MATLNNSNQAAEFWWRVSNGQLDAETLATLREVAYDIAFSVFETQYDPARKRAEAALKAVGFNGRRHKYQGLKELATSSDNSVMPPRDVAGVLGITAERLPEDFDEKIAAKSAERFRARARARAKR